MRALYAFFAVILLVSIPFIGVQYFHLQYTFGVLIPYVAFFTFILGFIFKILYWAKSPVPFNITTTAGQQKSLSWIKSDRFENPSSTFGVIGRMALEILVFRSLFRNSKAGLSENFKPGYASEKTLWLAGLVFHWSFFLVVVRHLRFFISPIPDALLTIETVDTLFQIGLPVLYLTDVLLVVSVSFLFIRRVIIPHVKYISLAADYFPLYIILLIAVTGMLMRYYARVDVMEVKNLTMGLVSFSALSRPVLPAQSTILYVHLFLVSTLLVYFPFSKLMHMGGIFFSPTRNMTGDARKTHHVNPWNYPVKVHTYQEYEEENKEAMKGAGLPVERE